MRNAGGLDGVQYVQVDVDMVPEASHISTPYPVRMQTVSGPMLRVVTRRFAKIRLEVRHRNTRMHSVRRDASNTTGATDGFLS